GFGLPAAVGAQVARPNDTVICISGDGSFMMNVQELGTVKRKQTKADAPKNRVINGIVELPKDQAVQLEPYDTVTVQGFYRSQPEV
ncbi:thiamine pyrophosphate-dependent enzyme, partial [Salmonella enterica subsp. enterica serovar Kentucky]|nr:thiamine pyrophosphate-dependent enzyme [Salmonella enterica subsp. enterica serovar Kentucky]